VKTVIDKVEGILLIGSRIRSFVWYRHRWPWWRNSTYFALFRRIRYPCRPITSQWLKIHYTFIVDRISSSAFGQNWPTLQRGLPAIAELLVIILCVQKKIASCYSETQKCHYT